MQKSTRLFEYEAPVFEYMYADACEVICTSPSGVAEDFTVDEDYQWN